ncbi:DsbA family oxidoreductase [Nocardiopsis coralliicola]
MSAPAPVTVTEYTDPGCVVSWASEPQLRLLRLRYGHLVRWRRVFGLQIADARADDSGFDAVGSAPARLERWTAAARATGAPITGRLHWLHSSTGPACRAAISARRQGPAVAERVLRRLREAVYLHGRPADSATGARRALEGVPGLDVEALLADFGSDRVHGLLHAEAAEARRVHPDTEKAARTGSTPAPGLPVAEEGGHRYGLPTVVVASAGRTAVVPGFRTPEEYEAALERVRPGITAGARPLPEPAELLAEFGTLTGREAELLAGGRLPDGALRTATATGDVWHATAAAPPTEEDAA